MFKVPVVSVIVVNYNGVAFIGECINSVLQSNYPSFEVVLIDNASTDGSYNFVKERFAKDKRVRLIRSKKQLYFTGGSNLGAFNAKGKKLIFLNSDTVVDNNWIKELVNFGDTHNNCLIQPKILSFQNKNLIDNVGGIYNYWGFGSGKGRGEHDSGQYDRDCLVDFVNGTCFMVDKKLFYDLGGFDEWYKYHYEDVDLCLRAKKYGINCWYCYKSIIYHKGSLTVKSQLKKTDLLFNIRKNRLRTVIKNYQGFQRLTKATGLFFVYFGQIIISFIGIKPTIAITTVQSIVAVVNFEHKIFIDRFRLRELKHQVGKKHFRLLDLGCGDGNLLDLALKAGIDALGVEATPRVHTKVIISSIESFTNKGVNKQYDVISLYHVFEHLRRPTEALSQIKKWLKPGGWVVIEVPVVGNQTNKFLGNKYFAYNDLSHHTFFTEKEVTDTLEQAGWEIKKKGFTLLEFPFTVITTSFRKNLIYGFLGLILFLPLKITSLVGLNTEILRVYCQKRQSTTDMHQ